MPDDVERSARGCPPSEWAGAAPLGGDVFWRPTLAEGGTVAVFGVFLVWHWCPEADRWSQWTVSQHQVISMKPLHLEPVLLWPCCGKHGFVRDGAWVEA
jgi:hypothetical protein